ncbi:MAG: hypothetical protein Q8R04_01700 [Nanoarchaeota archaeon]|nr:hypothetical protein [Nanoarchaeota archaeon]
MKIVNAFRKMSPVTRGLNGRKKINSIVFSSVLLQPLNPHPKINTLRATVKIIEPTRDIISLIFVGFINSLKFIFINLLLILINIMLFV